MKTLDLKGLFTTKKLIFLLLFSVLVLIGYQINFSAVLGTEQQYFTFFQFFGPIAGAFLGPIVGVASVLVAEVINFLFVGKEFNWINLFRLTPMLFAAYYFGTRKARLSAAIPIVCMALFMLHPVGSQAWYFSLYWLIPALARFLPKRLFAKSLGATFTAHAIGSTIFLYTIPTVPELWIMLIPVVAFERFLFASGISISYVLMNTFLAKVEHLVPAEVVSINQDYVLSKRFFRIGA